MNSLQKFMSKPVSKTEMKTNESTKKKWDLEEKMGFSFYKLINSDIQTKIYGIRNDLKNNLHALDYLYFIDIYIQELIKCIKNNKKLVKERSCSNECIIFANTPYKLQEIPKGTLYNGINKPKDIHWKTKDCNIQTLLDNGLLAGSRHIMLEIRHSSGMLKQWSGIDGVKNLLLHELSHTMCNHVTYRENGQYKRVKVNGIFVSVYERGNHEKHDFGKSEHFLKEISKKCKSGNLIEKNIIQLTKK